jgi:all-trans-retinol 13,14-reductase
MLYILISFVPWIIYWVLCGFGSPLGILVPFAISLLLVLPQIRIRSFNPMDLTSLIYFGSAALGTFLFDLDAFMKEGGFLGYFALFLMALFSMIAKRPYTLQVSKRDYPQVYWRDRLFLLVNQIITAVWAGIFLANALTFLLLRFPLTVILTNILIAAGIAFSIVFPMRAPAYLASREFRRYDWRVDVDVNRRREDDEYDVIVVGSGIGGLTCGSLLSKMGYRVLVLEQHHQVGGYCSSFARKGFIFNAGVEDVSGLWERGPVTYLLRELGLRKEDMFVRNTAEYVFRGRRIRAGSLEEFMELLSDMFPDERENIRAFFDDAKRAYEECYMDTQTTGAPLPPELISKVFGGRKLHDYPREHPHFYDWINKTFREKLDEHFRNEDLKALLCALLGYIGTTPEKAPASSALTACVSYYIHGGYFPKGGAQRFAEGLRDFIVGHGGTVLTGHRVDRILVEGGRVIGARVGDRIFKAPVVVSNVNARTTFLELIERSHLSKDFTEYIEGLKMSPSCFMVFLGVDMDLSGYPTLIKNMDEGYEIVINSNADRSLAPEGCSSVTLLTSASYDDFPERGTEAYARKKRELSRALIKKAEGIIPDLSRHIVVEDAATPKTFEKYTSVPRGAIYVFDQSIGVKRPCFKTPIKGLYLAGASTFPGGGIEAVVISGIICAHDISGWKIDRQESVAREEQRDPAG